MEETEDQLGVEVGVQRPGAGLGAGGRTAVAGHVEGRDAPARFGEARVRHQPVELAPVRAGGVQAENGAARAGCLAVQHEWAAGGLHRDVAPLRRRARRGSAQARPQRGRGRAVPAAQDPAPEVERAAQEMAMLRPNELVARRLEFRNAHAQREEVVVVPRRRRLEELRPGRGWCREGRVGLAAVLGDRGAPVRQREHEAHAFLLHREARRGTGEPTNQRGVRFAERPPAGQGALLPHRRPTRRHGRRLPAFSGQLPRRAAA
jgi:hypothetical protein